MNTIVLYFTEIALTLTICGLVVVSLSRSLRGVLVELCGTQERAKFWLAFASILLIGLPLIFGMGYNPEAATIEQAFFEIANQVKWNLLGFLVVLIGIGMVISFFVLVAPRPVNAKVTGG